MNSLITFSLQLNSLFFKKAKNLLKRKRFDGGHIIWCPNSRKEFEWIYFELFKKLFERKIRGLNSLILNKIRKFEFGLFFLRSFDKIFFISLPFGYFFSPNISIFHFIFYYCFNHKFSLFFGWLSFFLFVYYSLIFSFFIKFRRDFNQLSEKSLISLLSLYQFIFINSHQFNFICLEGRGTKSISKK